MKTLMIAMFCALLGACSSIPSAPLNATTRAQLYDVALRSSSITAYPSLALAY